VLRGAPLTADGMGAGLADGDPARDIDLPDFELEQWIVRDRFDHPPDLGARDDGADSGAERLVGGDLPGEGTDAQLVVVSTRQGMDHAPGISPEVPALR